MSSEPELPKVARSVVTLSKRRREAGSTRAKATARWMVVSTPSKSHPVEHHAQIVCGHLGDNRS
jgi:hypothetical protein